ncbi:TIGR04283 family arsenosugar biosynthesis glycosyltransferase [Oceanibium sediminis]|uniref:TIGR04283 family arsenosugar biosynthesis glycosyltransferase n=1 Tax=Oceanibium sediminis TaxID=2026339 RepID=UPI000DD48981|nr:TIGR04283 family arsenosugar biosynthesis glycosyltransferase [Oceanibium sediminis]
MPAPLSIVIPTLNAAPHLGPTLGALGEALTEGLIAEVILSDGGSEDDIATIAEATGATLVTGPPGRGGQIARGCAAAKGDWLLILHADSAPAPGWAAATRAHMNAHPGCAGYFDLRFDASGTMARVTAAWANRRARLGLPYGDQGLLIRGALYKSVGGTPDIPLMEDVALARALGRARLRPIGHMIVTSAKRYTHDGWLRRGARNLSTLALYFAGISPERLAARYNRR